MCGQFHASNRIFDADVTAKAKLVYLYFCRMANQNAQCFPSRKTIAAACGFSIESVKRAVKELAAHGLIIKAERHASIGRQTSNLYTIVSDSSGYFYAPDKIFDLENSTGAKLVFLYICRCADHASCFPAYSRIASMCGISISHVLACIRELEQSGLIQKISQYRLNVDVPTTCIHSRIPPSQTVQAAPGKLVNPNPFKSLLESALNGESATV